jgi:hypothetical protein
MDGGVFYCHPAGDRPGDLRRGQIERMEKACERAGVEFTEISDGMDDFLESVRENSLHRLVIIDDMCELVFNSAAGAFLFNMVGHHYK